jgi:MFS family permease
VSDAGQGDKTMEKNDWPFYRMIILALTGGYTFVSGLNNFTSGALLPLMAGDLAMSPLQQGFLGASTWLVVGALSIPFSCYFYWPKFNAKWLIAASGLTSAFGIFGQAYAFNYEIMISFRFMYAISAVVPMVAFTTIRLMWFPPKEYGTVGSITTALTTLGQFVALGAAPYLMSVVGGWRGVLFAFGTVTLIQAVCWTFFGRQRVTASIKSREECRTRGFPLKAALKRKEVWLLAIGLAGTPWIWQALLLFFPTYLLVTYQIPVTVGGPIISLLPIGSVIASFIGGPLSDKIRRRKPLIWPVGLFLPFLYYLMLQFRDTTILSILSFTTGFFAFIFVVPAFTIPFDLEGISAAECGAVVSFVTTITTIGSVLGPVLAGYAYQSFGSLATGLVPMCISPATLVAFYFMRETSPLSLTQRSSNRHA